MSKTAAKKRRAFGWIGRIKTRGKVAPGFYVRFQDKVTGKVVQRKGGETRAEAEKFLAQEMIRQGIDPGVGLHSTTLAEFWKDHHDVWSKARYSLGNYKAVRSQIDRAARYFQGRPMSKITLGDIEVYLRKLFDSGLSASTVRAHRAALSKAWARAKALRVVEANLPRQVELPAPAEKPLQYISPEDIDRALAAVRPTVRAIVTLTADTGARISEILNLRWRDVAHDFTSVNLHRVKTRTAGRVALTPRAQATLKRVHAERPPTPLEAPDWVFPSPYKKGHPYNRSYVYVQWKKAATKAGLRDTTLHGLRHAFAMHAINAQVPLPLLRDALGHTNLQTTNRYADYADASGAAQVVAAVAEARGQGRKKPRRRKKGSA